MIKVRQVGLSFIIVFLFTLLATSIQATRPASTPNSLGQRGQTPEVEPALLGDAAQIEENGYLIYFRQKAELAQAYQLDWEAR